MGLPCSIILALCFFVGTVLGFLLAFFGTRSVELHAYLEECLLIFSSRGQDVSFFSVFWDCLCWPVLLLVVCFTPFCRLVVPAILCARGFLLSYSVATFGLLLGREGLVVAGVLFAVDLLVLIPLTFVIACGGLRVSSVRNGGTIEAKLQFALILPCVGVMILAAVLQWCVTPVLLSATYVRLFT